MRTPANVIDSIATALAASVGRDLHGRELDVHPGITWAEVGAQLKPHEFGVIPKSAIAAPKDAGAIEGTGLPRGQSSDWRFPPAADCTGLHVQAFGELWEVHVDEVHPKCSTIDHARYDAPQTWVGAGMLGGAVLGFAVGRPLVGSLVGGALALVTLPRSSAR